MARMMKVAIVLSVAAHCAWAFEPCLDGVDYPNDDFPNMPLQMVEGDGQLCAAMCAGDSNCAMYVYMPAGCASGFSDAPVCYLKAQVPPSAQKSCRCSGFVNRTQPSVPTPDATAYVLSNGIVSFGLGQRGLTWLNTSDKWTDQSLAITVDLDSWVLGVDGLVINSTELTASSINVGNQSAQFVYLYSTNASSTAGETVQYVIAVTYQLGNGWRFVRKGMSVMSNASTGSISVETVSLWDALRITNPAIGTAESAATSTLSSVVYPTGDMGTYGLFARYADGAGNTAGILAAVENPFLYPSATPAGGLFNASMPSTLIHAGYHPSFIYNLTVDGSATTAYIPDAGILALYALGANQLPPYSESAPAGRTAAVAGQRGAAAERRIRSYAGAMPAVTATASTIVSTDTGNGMRLDAVVFDHSLAAQQHQPPSDPSWLYYSERDAFRYAADALYQLPPQGGIAVHIPWTENDYQIDISNGTQWDEYVRILTQLNRIDVHYLLYAGSNSAVSSIANNTDSWGWEEVLWLNEGQNIRTTAWTPGQNALPPSVAQLVETASALGVSAIPYIYPILGFTATNASAEWLYPTGHAGWYHSKLADRRFQDYLISTLIAFSNATGSMGAGYDYTFLEDSNSTQYAQWFGWRRVMSIARQVLGSDPTRPYVVDNRQLNHMWGPWMWVAGSYAEPLQTDEGPYSWPAAVLDPHTDRQSGNRQRLMNYDYAQSKFCPPSAMPGFMNHQSDRFYANNVLPYTDLNVRDYDYYGASYSILSGIASGGLNIVVCGIPARDEGEFLAFPETSTSTTDVSASFYRNWIQWASDNKQALLHTQFLPVVPAPGVIDGSYAVNPANNTGFIFLFNPNTRSLSTPSTLLHSDARLGIKCTPGDGSYFVIGEMYPVPSPAYTTVPCGGNFSLVLEGRSAVVLTITPAQNASSPSLAVNGPGVEHVPLFGRAARAHSRVAVSRQVDGSVKLLVTGISDLASPLPGSRDCSDDLAPLYVVVPDSIRDKVEGVHVPHGSDILPLDHHWIDDENIPTVLIDGCIPRSITPPPLSAVPHGHSLLAISTPPQSLGASTTASAAPTFVHSQPVQGMEYNPSFTGGQLNGTINVPAAVFAQLSARNASYPVPWTSDDLSVAWMAPGRVLLYLDVGTSVASGVTIPASITSSVTGQSSPIPVLPVFSCRSLQHAQCFSGYWIDLSAAGIVADTPYGLSITLPSNLPAGVFQGVYYDNVDTVYQSW